MEKYDKWLVSADPSPNHGLAHRIHHDESSQWLVKDNDELEGWKREGSLFLLHGKCESLVTLKEISLANGVLVPQLAPGKPSLRMWTQSTATVGYLRLAQI